MGNLSGEARLDGSAADAHCLAVCSQHPRTMMPSIERLRTALAVRAGSINHHEAVPTSHTHAHPYFPNSIDSLLSPLEQRWEKVKHVRILAPYLGHA
jgi:hypothetical protein